MLQSNQTIDSTATIVVQQQVAVQTAPVTTTTVMTKEALAAQNKKDIASSWQVTGISMTAIFGFMILFFLVIKGIDKMFPYKEEKK